MKQLRIASICPFPHLTSPELRSRRGPRRPSPSPTLRPHGQQSAARRRQHAGPSSLCMQGRPLRWLFRGPVPKVSRTVKVKSLQAPPGAKCNPRGSKAQEGLTL